RRERLEEPPSAAAIAVVVVPTGLPERPLRRLRLRFRLHRGRADRRIQLARARVGAVVERHADLLPRGRDPARAEVFLGLVEETLAGGLAGIVGPLVVPHLGVADQGEDVAELPLLEQSF